jgi:hypothetical protein
MTGDGRDLRHPQVINRDDLDLAGLRAHIKAMHRVHPGGGRRRGGGPVPRANLLAAGWHWAQHFCMTLSHRHEGPWTVVRDARGRTVGALPRPLGCWTGQEPVTREQDAAAWRARHTTAN